MEVRVGSAGLSNNDNAHRHPGSLSRSDGFHSVHEGRIGSVRGEIIGMMDNGGNLFLRNYGSLGIVDL
jgi:hypothetical protein